MRIDALAVRLRSRTPMEAADLGVQLCHSRAQTVFGCFALQAIPVMVVSLATIQLKVWLPILLIWWLKPWLDQSVLFVLARATFGQPVTVRDLWRAQGAVWWKSLPLALTVRRFSPWRSLTQAVYQLEGLPLRTAGARVRQVRRRTVASGLMMTHAFAMAEVALSLSLMSLVFWMTPRGLTPDLSTLLTGEFPTWMGLLLSTCYAAAVLILEPFYVAAGFGMYLNRRADLEAWDVEQELRRAFAA